ncbi:MAG: elongation factor P [Mollicutes bacterium PWAP]|nr:elongation factor P [Mollicutes bacterium PWAP]
MINVNNLKPGITFQEQGIVFVVISTTTSKQGRGQPNVKAKVKNMFTGAITVKSYTGGDKVKPAFVDKKEMDYLYKAGSEIVLMDSVSYDQIQIPSEKIQWEKNFLIEGMKIKVRSFNDKILDIELPANISMEVIEAAEAVKGNTANNPQKKVIVETGFELDVPMFIKKGAKIIVSSESGKYQGRA